MPLRPPSVICVLTGLLLGLCFTLLVGARFGATWAGGEGVTTQWDAYVGHAANDGQRGPLTSLPRGSTHTTDADHYDWYQMSVMFKENASWLVLSPKTTVTLLSNTNSDKRLQLITGRVYVHGPATIVARDINVHVAGNAMVTNYSWKYELEIFALSNEPVVITRGNEHWSLQKNQGALLHLTDSSIATDTSLIFTLTDANRELINIGQRVEVQY